METVVISQCEDVVRKRKFSVYSLLFLAIAVVTAYLYSSYQGEAGASIRMALISLLGGKKRIFLKATGERVREYELFFDVRDYGRLSSAIETKQFADISRLKQFTNDNSGIKMEMLVSDDRQYLTVQLSQYKPFSYDVASPLLTFQGDDAQKLSDELLKQAVEV